MTLSIDGGQESSTVERPKLIATAREVLPTVVEDAAGTALRRSSRKTDIQIYDSGDETGWLYELGIPIQPLECPFHVSVEQKVPLDPNRSAVSTAFLNKIYAIVLNEAHTCMPKDQVSENWVSEAVQSNLSKVEARLYVMDTKYEKTLLRSSNAMSNEDAVEAGYKIIDSRLIPANERKNLEEVGLVPASQMFRQQTVPGTDVHRNEWSEGMIATEQLAGWMGSIWEIPVKVRFVDSPTATVLAQYCKLDHFIQYNLSRLGGKGFFACPLSWEVISLTLHEISHERGEGHDAEYRQGMEELATRLMLKIAKNPNDLQSLLGMTRDDSISEEGTTDSGNGAIEETRLNSQVVA